jgi:hypothetical protein
MEKNNKAIIFLLIVILAVIIFFGIKLIGESKKTLSGSVIKEEEPINIIKHEVYEQETQKIVNEEIIEEEITKELEESPTQKQFETFKVDRLEQDSRQALIFYEINSEDIRCPINESGIIIFFDEAKTYLGYEELKKFLNEKDIVQLLAFGGDNVEALQDIREQTGIPIMIKFGRSIESEEPLYC